MRINRVYEMFGDKTAFYVVLALTLAGGMLRFYSLGSQSFWIDEVYSATAAKGMLTHLVPYMPGGSVYERDILNTAFITISMAVFGVNEAAARLPSAIFGTLMIPLAYIAARKFFGNTAGAVTAYIITFSYVEIAWSRQARMYQQLQFFYLLSLLLFYKYLEDRKTKTAVLTLIATAGAFLSHRFGFSLLLIYPAYAALDMKLGGRKMKMPQKTLVAAGLFIGLGLVFSEMYLHTISAVLSSSMNYLPAYVDYFKTAFPASIYLAVVGLLLYWKDTRRPTLLCVLAFIIPFYFISYRIKLLGFRYAYFLLPFIIMFAAKALTYVAKEIWGKRKTTAIAILILLFSISGELSFTPQTTYYLESRAPQPDFNSVYPHLKDNIKQGDTLIVDYPEVALWYGLKPDYWLAFSISGFPVETVLTANKTHYAQTMTPAITSADELTGILNETHGWLVLDSLAANRIPQDYWPILTNKTTWLPGPSKPGQAGAINLYRWGNDD
ncbi:Dolichyl-phosphate-mannose-protein mannosyltransferase [uncultured archaeon]|nr:Dolichyl-phosphate-mannose-protein mannosyltransferase [uncultured archaeon]